MFEVFVYIVSVSPTPDMKTLQFETGSFGLRSFEISTTRHLVGKPIDWFFVVIFLFVWVFFTLLPWVPKYDILYPRLRVAGIWMGFNR